MLCKKLLSSSLVVAALTFASSTVLAHDDAVQVVAGDKDVADEKPGLLRQLNVQTWNHALEAMKQEGATYRLVKTHGEFRFEIICEEGQYYGVTRRDDKMVQKTLLPYQL